MTYTIKLMNKSEVVITEQERNNLKDKSGLVYIPSQDRIINTNSIVEVARSDDIRNISNTGILHDGLPVVRQFGRWYLNDGNIDDQGRLKTVVDPTHYPEVANDNVMSPERYEQVKHLSRDEIKRLHGGDRNNNGMKQIAANLPV
jgi:hypothetical protein